MSANQCPYCGTYGDEHQKFCPQNEINLLRTELAFEKNTTARLRAELAVANERADNAERQNIENGQSFHPEFCPVTGRPFFMTIEGEDGRMVATYGGPFDSYTIPEWDPRDKEFRSERYDHDRGHWIEGGEPYSFILVDEQEHFALEDRAETLQRQRDELAAALERQTNKCAQWQAVFEQIPQEAMDSTAHDALSAVYSITNDGTAQDTADAILAAHDQEQR